MCSKSLKQSTKYKAIVLHDSERLTITEAVRQFRVSRINDRDCPYSNIGKVEKTDYFSKLPQILVFKREKSVANDGQLENESFIYETNINLRDADRTVCYCLVCLFTCFSLVN